MMLRYAILTFSYYDEEFNVDRCLQDFLHFKHQFVRNLRLRIRCINNNQEKISESLLFTLYLAIQISYLENKNIEHEVIIHHRGFIHMLERLNNKPHLSITSRLQN